MRRMLRDQMTFITQDSFHYHIGGITPVVEKVLTHFH